MFSLFFTIDHSNIILEIYSLCIFHLQSNRKNCGLLRRNLEKNYGTSWKVNIFKIMNYWPHSNRNNLKIMFVWKSSINRCSNNKLHYYIDDSISNCKLREIENIRDIDTYIVILEHNIETIFKLKPQNHSNLSPLQ